MLSKLADLFARLTGRLTRAEMARMAAQIAACEDYEMGRTGKPYEPWPGL